MKKVVWGLKSVVYIIYFLTTTTNHLNVNRNMLEIRIIPNVYYSVLGHHDCMSSCSPRNIDRDLHSKWPTAEANALRGQHWRSKLKPKKSPILTSYLNHLPFPQSPSCYHIRKLKLAKVHIDWHWWRKGWRLLTEVRILAHQTFDIYGQEHILFPSLQSYRKEKTDSA